MFCGFVMYMPCLFNGIIAFSLIVERYDYSLFDSTFLLGKNLYNNEHVAIKLVSRNLLYFCLLFKLSWRNTGWDIFPLGDGKYRIFFFDRNLWNLGHHSCIWNTDFIKYLEMLVSSCLVVHEYGKKKLSVLSREFDCGVQEVPNIYSDPLYFVDGPLIMRDSQA